MNLANELWLAGYVSIVALCMGMLLVWRKLEGERAKRLRRQTIGLILGRSLIPAGMLLMDRMSGVAWALFVCCLVAVSLFLLRK